MSIVDQLLDSYALKDESFSIELPHGEKLQFRNLSDYVEIKALDKRAKAFAKKHVKGMHGGNKGLEEFATDDENLAVMAYIIGQLSIEPKLTTADVLKLSRLAAPVTTLISNEITKRLVLESAVSETEELDELGED